MNSCFLSPFISGNLVVLGDDWGSHFAIFVHFWSMSTLVDENMFSLKDDPRSRFTISLDFRSIRSIVDGDMVRRGNNSLFEH